MANHFETSRSQEAGSEYVRPKESPERTAERVASVERGERLARTARALGDSELEASRAEAPALLAQIEPVGKESAENDEDASETALRAVERALRPAARPDLLKIAREAAAQAALGESKRENFALLSRIAADPSSVPKTITSLADAKDWAAKVAEKSSDSSEFDRKADVLIARLREANPAAADQAEAEFQAYRREAADRPDALDRRGFLAGWYACNSEAVLAGVPETRREAVRADLAGLSQVKPDAVERYAREVLPASQRRRAEAAMDAQRAVAGVRPGADQSEARDLGDGRTAVKGEKGWMVVGSDGKAQTMGPDGRPYSAFDANRPEVVLAGPQGFPVSTLGADPERIRSQVEAVNEWSSALSARHLDFISGEQLFQLQGIVGDMPRLTGSEPIRFTEAPTPATLAKALRIMERMLGFPEGGLFSRAPGIPLRADVTDGDGLEARLAQSMRERGLVTLGGGLRRDAVEKALSDVS